MEILFLKYLSYSIDELRSHLESGFESWMNWDNYGSPTFKERRWNIDPQSVLTYTSMEDENFKKCWDLTNLRAIDAIKNSKKGNKINFVCSSE
jgi:hypothetical protein